MPLNTRTYYKDQKIQMRSLLSLSFLLLSLSSALADGINSAPNSDLPIGAGGDVVMVIKGSGTNNGNIGIGNSNPQQKLDVTGNIAASGEIHTGNSGTTCTAATAGALRWTGTAFEGCNGTDWGFLGGTIPAGAVMAFNLATCPATWTPLANIAGRAIIGAGQGDTAEGWNWGSVYNVGSRGGFETHTLSIPEMPSHSHAIDVGQDALHRSGGGQLTLNGGYTTRYTNAQGSNQPHNNMMPYMALLYCQKL